MALLLELSVLVAVKLWVLLIAVAIADVEESFVQRICTLDHVDIIHVLHLWRRFLGDLLEGWQPYR